MAGRSTPAQRKGISLAAIREATGELLRREGARGVTHQRVAELAGVGRATVYRHFPTVTDLVEDALVVGGVPDLPRDPGHDLRQRIAAAASALVDELTDPSSQAVITTVLDRARNPGRSRRLRDAYVHSLVVQLSDALEESGADASVDAERLFDLLAGPLVSSVLLRGVIPDEGAIVRSVNDALVVVVGLDERH